jgi:stearoyl-CoA desaturase (delta-9 desaturase)
MRDTRLPSSLGAEPWRAAWWKPAKGEAWTFVYIVMVHALAVVGLVLFPIPSWPVLLAAVALAWLGGLGTTVCYHRALAHRALVLHPVVRHALIFFAMWNGSGAPVSWVANHRQHHARVDSDHDVSSPRVGGFFWAHLRWLWQVGEIPIRRWTRDLDQPQYRAWRRLQIPVVAISLCAGLPFGAAAFFWIGPLRLVYSLHAQCFVNSSAHRSARSHDGEGSARNIPWLSLMQLFQGESWHANHHARPAAARLGWRWFEVDGGWYVILLLEALGLATKVSRSAPSAHELRRKSSGTNVA